MTKSFAVLAALPAMILLFAPKTKAQNVTPDLLTYFENTWRAHDESMGLWYTHSDNKTDALLGNSQDVVLDSYLAMFRATGNNQFHFLVDRTNLGANYEYLNEAGMFYYLAAPDNSVAPVAYSALVTWLGVHNSLKGASGHRSFAHLIRYYKEKTLDVRYP